MCPLSIRHPARGSTPRCAANSFRSWCRRCLSFRRTTNAPRHEVPEMLTYTKDHEWLRLEGDLATAGITPFAEAKLGELVYVELTSIGATFVAGAAAATVESVKAASDVYAPVGGEIVAVNDKVVAEPGLVNAEPTGNGWLFKMRVGNAAELNALLDELAYKKLTEE